MNPNGLAETKWYSVMAYRNTRPDLFAEVRIRYASNLSHVLLCQF